MKAETKQCKNCQAKFIIEPDDFTFYKKMEVPVPGICPDCRFKWRSLWRNEMTLYSGQQCDLCQKDIVTIYNPKSPYTVYCYDCYFSEKWDPKDYATDYDFSRPFVEQMGEFLTKVPKVNLGNTPGNGLNINSHYINMANGCKNCYLVFNTSPSEELLYSRGVRSGVDSSDIYFGTEFERCYESINVQKSAGVIWGQNVVSCVDSAFILNGSGLTNCFGCVNLRNKSFHFLNQPLKSEEYKKKVDKILGSYSEMEKFKKEFQEFSLAFPRRENNNLKSVDSTGDYLFECKNVKHSFEVGGGEDSKYLFSSKGVKDSIGTIGYGTQSERLLEVVATGFCSNVIGSFWPEHCQNIMYSFFISNCNDCIGCDGLKNSKYAVFNKEYSLEDYEKIKKHITEELTELGLHGLMMPPEIAPFAYNETVAQDNMPLTKEEALAQGFRWEDDLQKTEEQGTLKIEDVPDHIKDVSDSITKEVLSCIDCRRNYKITKQELSLYKKMSLPIPRNCFYCRHQDRVKRRGAYEFFDRSCANCKKAIYTNYSPDGKEIVYCEQCYQQEVI